MPRRGQKPFVFVLWLLPAPPERDFFSGVIKRLARNRNAPIFAPHLTLGLCRMNPIRPPRIIPSPIRLRVVGISSSSIFTKTLFVRFDSNPGLEELRKTLGVNAGDYDPHLSLLYCRLPAGERSRLVRGIKLPFSSVGFDKISVVRCPSPTENRSEVESWEEWALNKLQFPAVQDHSPAQKNSPGHEKLALED